MLFWQRVGLAVSFGALCVLGLSGRALAQNISVTIGVGDTVLTVQGQSSPQAFVTIVNDGSVIGTTQAAADGTYSQTFPAQNPGLHTLNIYAHSVGGHNTDTVTLNINIAEHFTTTADVFLPPTLITEDATLDHGQNLTLSGETFPHSTVKVFIDNTDFVTATADAQGNWAAIVDTSLLASGQHEYFVRATDPLGSQSSPSALRVFLVAPKPEVAVPLPTIKTPRVPTITFPVYGTIWDHPTITILGQADPLVQIELWDGEIPIGSVWSQTNRQWLLSLVLQAKTYQLRARACLSGKCSAFSPITLLTYQPRETLSPLQLPLIVQLPQLSYTITEGQDLTLHPAILQGQPPYSSLVQWGDGASQSGTHAKDQPTLTHTYAKAGKYAAVLQIKDAQGRTGNVAFTVDVLPTQFRAWPIIILLILLFVFMPFIALRWFGSPGSGRSKTK